MPRSQDPLPEVLAGHRRYYELLVELVRHYAERGDVEHVLRAAMLAGNYAWWAPVGLLSDLRLERLVVDAVRGAGTVEVDGDRRAGRVLHVLSEAHPVGGHTRLAWRWMDRDDRTSDVVLTNQSLPVPAALAASVQASGGVLLNLRSTTPALLDRARELRAQMDRADLVVLHVNPYDVVALAAANLPGPRPPVIFENHADLGFWVGVGAADVLCDLRPTVRGINISLRRVPEERIAVLPMPVDAMDPADGAVDDVRRRLRLRPDAVVALTVSDVWKVASHGGRGLHDVVDKVLHASPKLAYVLVGVPPTPEWDRLARRYPGRVHLTGRIEDPAPYFALADVYLESYPNFAGTTPLEAALVGLPVVGLADVPDHDPRHLFQRWSPGLAGLAAASTPGRLALAVSRLVADAELRLGEGAAAQAAVSAAHDNPGWRERLEELYERARSASAADVRHLGDSPTDDGYGALLLRTLTPTATSRDPRGLVPALGEVYDATLEGDLRALLMRGKGSSVQVRVAQRWADHPAWTARLLALAAARPRLRVSMPFLPGDDVHGTRTVGRLTELLATVGLSTEDCGDVALEHSAPQAALALSGELVYSDDTLDRLAELAGSPLWETRAADRAPVPVAG